MKKLVSLLLLTIVLGCAKDYDFEILPNSFIPDNLKIAETSGIKLESNIVTSEVTINVKLPADGTYRIKLTDLTGKTVSQEKITATEGNNLLKIYVKSLPVSSYKVELLTETNQLLGSELFAIKN